LQEGVAFGDGEEYTPGEYNRMASAFSKDYKAKNYPEHELLMSVGVKEDATNDDAKGRTYTAANLERDYWEIVETRNREIAVEYGNDVDTTEFGSGFPLSERGRSVYGTCNEEKVKLPEPKFGTKDYYKETWWNTNNIPWAPDSVLRHVKVGINGINVPWMYYGSLFTTFCWHNEDNYLYSINYHHTGAPKQWYGVPGTQKDAEGLEKVFKNYLSMKMRDVPDLLHHITTMFSPRLLQKAEVPIYKLLQHEREFVVTFPRAFHGGFSMGPNIGEAVNFATHDWIAHGSDANERYRSFARPAVFSHDRLTFTMAQHLGDQKSYKNCKLLLKELDRIVIEELQLRQRLIETGVRDVSDLIKLPKNRLDQLDEESADYDDKRLCHACKHVCFFSAVACECSQTKVSCLRHSHFMCRCCPERRYLMIWSTEDELQQTLKHVRDHCESLMPEDYDGVNERSEAVQSRNVGDLSALAVGVEQDLENHKAAPITTEPYSPPPDVQHSRHLQGSSRPLEVITDDEKGVSDEGENTDDA
jgi:JmjC domain, hydroxylase/C5HC2 zinc finger